MTLNRTTHSSLSPEDKIDDTKEPNTTALLAPAVVIATNFNVILMSTHDTAASGVCNIK